MLSPQDKYLQDILGEPKSPPFPEISFKSWEGLIRDTPSERAVETQRAVTTAGDPRAVLKQYWGYDDFRGIQREIIDSILDGQDTVGLMPTGGGKSVTFQVPALMMEGICLVITPLIALMKDQVEHLRSRGIRATMIHSGMTRAEIVQELDNAILGNYKFLYLSPERIHTEIFQIKLEYMNVSFIAVDEAHCISQWGFDFRPSYLQLSALREWLPEVPILALTATATAIVLDDIQECLRFRKKRVFRMSFARKNIAYRVKEVDVKEEELFRLLDQYPGTAIVYTRSREGTVEAAESLNRNGISALYYHAGLNPADKDARQESWQTGRTRVMVATNAFGMGIDKPDVRLVVHLDPPDSIEAYFQEAGRAGRDGKPSVAYLLFNSLDKFKFNSRVRQTFPPKEKVRDIYEDIGCYYQMAEGCGEGARFEFDLNDFSRKFKHFPLTVTNALTILERGGYMAYTPNEERTSRVMMLVRREDFYHHRSRYPETEKVLTALMRNYSGLFTQYVFIDEEKLAKEAELAPEDIYGELLALSRMRLLDYVPRRATDRITFLRDRVDKERVALPPEVYETRREQYDRRINGMLNYCLSPDVCRSQFLLQYFDDHDAQPCGVCDVCLGE